VPFVVRHGRHLARGAHRAAAAAIRTRRLAFVEAILARFPLLEIDLEVARAHAGLWSSLAQKGEMIDVHDSWIAATCIAHDLTLVTGNPREFDRAPGLGIENWMAA
jgi:tRNA(fMet)-specific endonuclease VapC